MPSARGPARAPAARRRPAGRPAGRPGSLPWAAHLGDLAFLGAAGGALFATLIGWAAPLWWCFALFEHFRVQYAVVGLLVAVGATVAKRPVPALLAVLVVGLNVAAIAPSWLQPEAPSHHGAPLDLLVLNVKQDNHDHARVAHLLETSDADVVGLIEVDSKWLHDLAPALARWPYRQEQPHDRDVFGMALYSKRPFEFREVRTFELPNAASIVARIALDGGPVTFVLIHPPPATSSAKAALQQHFYDALTAARAGFDEVVVMGDFNATPWSYALRKLRERTGLVDSRRGFGLATSWPTATALLRIPIDQVLVSPRIVVLSREVGDKVGSDHFPVSARIAMVK